MWSNTFIMAYVQPLGGGVWRRDRRLIDMSPYMFPYVWCVCVQYLFSIYFWMIFLSFVLEYTRNIGSLL